MRSGAAIRRGFSGTVWISVGLLALLACASPPPAPPPVPEPPAWREAVRTLAIAPLFSVTSRVSAAQATAAFEERVTKRLVDAGFEVVGSDVWDAIWRRRVEDVGPIFDASTGKPDEERHALVRDAVHRELAEDRGVDAILLLEIRVDETYGSRVAPEACGDRIQPWWPGGWKPEGDPALLVRISCLAGFLVVPGGEQLFARQAGLEGIETWDAQTRAVRPAAEMLQDAAVLDRAVGVVLEPLLLAPPPDAAPPTDGA